MFALDPTPRRHSIMSHEGDGHGVQDSAHRKREEYIEGNLKLCETM